MKANIATFAMLAAMSTTSSASVLKRQVDPNSSDDLLSGECKDVLFIWARGSMEPGNMGIIIGPAVCTALKNKLPGKLACQGIGAGYKANIFDNGQPTGTSPAATVEAANMFKTAVQKCPNSKIIFGGYSQGGAVVSTAIQTLDQSVKDRLLGGALFGDTLNQRNKHEIPGFPANRVKQYCTTGDGICEKAFRGITEGHLAYGMNGMDKQAADWLINKVENNGGGAAGGEVTGKEGKKGKA